MWEIRNLNYKHLIEDIYRKFPYPIQKVIQNCNIFSGYTHTEIGIPDKVIYRLYDGDDRDGAETSRVFWNPKFLPAEYRFPTIVFLGEDKYEKDERYKISVIIHEFGHIFDYYVSNIRPKALPLSGDLEDYTQYEIEAFACCFDAWFEKRDAWDITARQVFEENLDVYCFLENYKRGLIVYE